MNFDDLIGTLILILIFIFYIISMIFRFSLCDFPEYVRYIEPYEMNTGDIVCVSYNNPAGAFVGSMTYSAWVHTAMIWVDPETNVRYVLEGAIYRQKAYKHFYKIPVSTWLYINKNNLTGYKKYNGPPVDPYKMMEVFKPFMENTKLEGFRYTWFRFLFKDGYQKTKYYKRKHTCFEVTVIMGQECGIYKKNRSHYSYFPSHVVNDQIETENGIFYSKVIQCVQNPLEALLFKNDKEKYTSFWKAESLFKI